MDLETYNAFWMEVEDSVLNNKGKNLDIEFDVSMSAASEHFCQVRQGYFQIRVPYCEISVGYCGARVI